MVIPLRFGRKKLILDSLPFKQRCLDASLGVVRGVVFTGTPTGRDASRYNRADIRSLFESVVPYFDAGMRPSDDVSKLKMIEGAYVQLDADKYLYASLFDFVDPWKKRYHRLSER